MIDLQRDWYESISDGIGYQQNWQNDAKSLRPSATVEDFNNINTNQPSGTVNGSSNIAKIVLKRKKLTIVL